MHKGSLSTIILKLLKYETSFIRGLSRGNQKKAGIIGALMGNPELVIPDESFANLAPTSQFKLRKIFKDFAS